VFLTRTDLLRYDHQIAVTMEARTRTAIDRPMAKPRTRGSSREPGVPAKAIITNTPILASRYAFATLMAVGSFIQRQNPALKLKATIKSERRPRATSPLLKKLTVEASQTIGVMIARETQRKASHPPTP
jgi:hypothetical protein